MADQTTDEQLLDEWRAGDRSSGNVLLRRHFAAIFRFFAGKIDCPEDLTQRTFQACAESRDRIEGRVRPYLFGIARFQLLMYLRSNGRFKRRFSPQEHSVAASITSPSQVVARQENQQRLLVALRDLPLDLQITVEMVYWEGMSVAEVASITEVPPGTVKSRLHRARRFLRRSLEAEEVAEDQMVKTFQSLNGWAEGIRKVHDEKS